MQNTETPIRETSDHNLIKAALLLSYKVLSLQDQATVQIAFPTFKTDPTAREEMLKAIMYELAMRLIQASSNLGKSDLQDIMDLQDRTHATLAQMIMAQNSPPN